MFSFSNFNTVARFESKTLMRSWFLRIFAIIGLIVLILFNILVSQQEFSPRILRGLPTNIPYGSLLIFNVIQAVIASFLATDFMKRDKKQDTTEVIYARPLSNGEYIWGKIYGNLRVFLALNVLILIIPLIFTLVTKDMVFDPLGYGLYFVLISIPTLLFIFGLSFFLMALIRNQAVVLLILLGYIALTLFYLNDKLFYIFDYMSFNIPMMWSEFTGLANPDRIILHKALYISLGLSLVFFTVLLMKRLRQSNSNYWISIAGGILFLGAASWLTVNHVDQEITMRRFRDQLIKLNDQYLKTNVPVVNQYKLNLKHEGGKVSLIADMTIRNRGNEALDTIIFSINPGFKVDKCSINGQENGYDQKQHLVLIDRKLPVGDSANITLSYDGYPDERVCYLEVPNDLLFRGEHEMLFRVPKKFSFLNSEYLMFTPELLWYPLPGTGFSSKNVAGFPKNFSDFQLTAEVGRNMRVLSQGKPTQKDNKWTFEPKEPLTCLSVIAGKYRRDSLTVGEITYNIYYKKDHDFYKPFFSEVQDTIPSLINRVMDDYESQIHLDYPFRDFSLVEVPAHFYAYKKNFTLANEASLPQMVMMKERAYSMNGADFPRMVRRFQRRGRDSDRSPEEMKADIFRRFIHSNFIEGEDFRRGWFDQDNVTGNTKIFPNFVSYCNDFGVEELPVMNPVLERYIDNRAAEDNRGFFFGNDGVGAQERANLLLQENSFAELMSDTSNFVRLSDVIDVKGSHFINLMKHFAGSADFDPVLDSFIVASRYKNNAGEQFLDYVKNRYNVDTEKYMSDWLYARELPAFTFENVEVYSYYKGERPRYQAEITVTNTGGSLGLVQLSMRIGRRRNSSMSEEQAVTLEPGQSKRVGINVGESPSMMIANTLVSSNMPSTLRFPLRNIEEDENAAGGAFVRETEPPKPNEEAIVVDNEDPYFRLLEPEKATKLRDLLRNKENQDEYTDVNVWRPPEEWQKAIHNQFYGKVKLSAV
ncbi:MAG: ABC transporter permease, partial [Bacteroidales bacterium]|nr:ABC transporter permease [Bacteroidales bacterium]